MTLTISTLTNWFNEFNALYFGNELPMPTFKISDRSKRVLGNCKADANYGYFADRSYPRSKWYRFTITMFNYYDREEYWLKNTFIHEMIHEWQWVTYGKADHRYTFQNKAYEINIKGGWQIATHSDLDKEGIQRAAKQTRTQPQASIVCILSPTSRKKFVACLASETLKDRVAMGWASQSPKFYRVKKQDTFETFPRTGRGESLRGRNFASGSPELKTLMDSLEAL